MAKPQPVEPRFIAKVQKTEDCWLWTATIEHNGYGRFWLNGRQCGAHRVAYEMYVGPIPDGLEIDHLCRVRHCVNPDHLEAVTASENVRRMTTVRVPYQHLKSSCPNGHPYNDDNTESTPTGRACRTCKREANSAYYARNRQLTIERARAWRLNNVERYRELARVRARERRAKEKAGRL